MLSPTTSRRDFLKTAAVTAGAAAVLPLLPKDSEGVNLPVAKAKPKIVEIIARSHDYMARWQADPGAWGCSRTPLGAVICMMWAHPEEAGKWIEPINVWQGMTLATVLKERHSIPAEQLLPIWVYRSGPSPCKFLAAVQVDNGDRPPSRLGGVGGCPWEAIGDSVFRNQTRLGFNPFLLVCSSHTYQRMLVEREGYNEYSYFSSGLLVQDAPRRCRDDHDAGDGVFELVGESSLGRCHPKYLRWPADNPPRSAGG